MRIEFTEYSGSYRYCYVYLCRFESKTKMVKLSSHIFLSRMNVSVCVGIFSLQVILILTLITPLSGMRNLAVNHGDETSGESKILRLQEEGIFTTIAKYR